MDYTYEGFYFSLQNGENRPFLGFSHGKTKIFRKNYDFFPLKGQKGILSF